MSQVMERTPDLIATEINVIKESARLLILQSSVEIGKRLVEAKALVNHGSWGDWLEKNVDYSQSTANNLMKIYREYSSNSQAFGNLSYSQAVALLAVPAEEREAFVQENEVEKMSTREIQKAIKEKQKAIEEKEALEKKLQKIEEEKEKQRLEKQEMSERYARLEKESKEHAEKIKQLDAQLEQARSAGANDEAEQLQRELAQMKEELSKSQSKIKTLEKELNEKPIEVSATVVKIPDEVEKELAELRRKVNENEKEALVAFKYCFDSLVKGFNDLLNTLEQVKDSEPSKHQKFQSVVIGLIEEMRKNLAD